MPPRRTLSAVELRLLRPIFKRMDADGSEDISREEFVAAVGEDPQVQAVLQTAGDMGSVNAVFDELDEDGDGEVTWAEFEAFFSGNTLKGRTEEDEANRKIAESAAFMANLNENQSKHAQRMTMLYGRTRASTFIQKADAVLTEDGYDVDDVVLADEKAQALAAVEEQEDGTGLRGAAKAQVLRAMRADSLHYVEDKQNRKEMRQFFDCANSLILGKQVLTSWEDEEHLKREKRIALGMSLKMQGAMIEAKGASLTSASEALSAAHKHAAAVGVAKQRESSKSYAVGVATREALHHIDVHAGGIAKHMVPTEYSRWARRQRQHTQSVCGTWMYGDKHVHHTEIAPGVRVEISRPVAEAAVKLQKCFRGRRARKKADAVWSTGVQHDLRAMRLLVRRSNVRERTRIGHKISHWAQVQLGLNAGM